MSVPTNKTNAPAPSTQVDREFLGTALTVTAQHLHAVLMNGLSPILGDLANQLSDIRRLLMADRLGDNPVTLITDHPIAHSSNDHLHPWGTRNDNTRSSRFCFACERHFAGRPLAYLDLGCSGGGVVFDFLLRGHFAMGLEGSDFSLKTQRAEWRTIGDYLRTCDITKPFSLVSKSAGEIRKFEVIGMWEVLEHIGEEDLGTLFSNIKNHLAADGIFIGSIALIHDIVNGVDYHKTVKPAAWWEDTFKRHGLAFTELPSFTSHDFCRGTGNGPMDPDFSKTPSAGFHFIAKRS